jgi:SPP1 family predicted phage head-tail adaptor
MSIGHLLNRSPNVWRKVETDDGMGGFTVEWVNQGTVDARFSRPAPSEREVAAQRGVEITHDVYFKPGTEVTRGDRLVDGNLTVEIVSLVSPSRESAYLKGSGREEPWAAPTEDGS